MQIARYALTYITTPHDQQAFTAKARWQRAKRALV